MPMSDVGGDGIGLFLGALALVSVGAIGAVLLHYPKFDTPSSADITLALREAVDQCYAPRAFARDAAAVAHVLAVTDADGALLQARLVSVSPDGTAGYLHARMALQSVRDCAPYQVGAGRTVLTLHARKSWEPGSS